MKTPRTANAVGHIDDDLITAAAENKRKAKGSPWLKWGSIAACFAVLVAVGIVLLQPLMDGNVPGESDAPAGSEASAGTDDRYKDFYIHEGEIGIVWPWEYRTVYEQYTELEIDGREFIGSRREVSASFVGERIGNYTVTGYEEFGEGEKHTEEFEVYKLKDAQQSRYVAVKMDGRYYVFKNDEYAPPGTLGELFGLVDLSKVIELNRFSENGDDPSKNHFTLNNDDYVWEVLAGCENAEFVEDDRWRVHDREYLSFTITSEALGVYRVAMYVTEDGYLWTNAFSHRYLFDIGEDAAGKIIGYARENSTEAAYEPYRNSVVGTVTEITDEYMVVDDSVLCNDPEEGIAYRVLLNDLRISRYVDCGVIEAGDTVQITYEGEIGADHIISDAISSAAVKISGGDVLIPE